MYDNIDEFLNCKSILGAESFEELKILFSKRYTENDFAVREKKPANIKYWLSQKENRKVNPLFDYKHNSFGFRDKELLLETDMLCIGCSVSYGVGVPEDLRWSNVLAKTTNLSFNNLSVVGISTYEIAMILISFLKFIKTKKVFILLPESNRELIPKIEPNGEIVYFNTFDNYKSIKLDNLEYEISDNYYKLPETYHLDKFRSIVQFLLLYLESKNIDTYIGTWSKISSKFINKFIQSNFQKTKIIDLIERDCKGRDMKHPGVLYHKNLANVIYEKIKNDL